MKLKRIAVRAAVILFVVVGLCMFFGQTLLTLTTPKVKLIDAQTGRLEDKIRVSAELYFSKPQSYTIDDARDLPVTVDKVWVSPGDEVKAGDILFTCKLQSKYEEDYKKALEALQKEQADALKTEMENVKVNVNARDTAKNDAEDKLYQKEELYTDTQVKLITLAAEAGVILTGDMNTWKERLGDAITPEMSALFDALGVLEKERAQAQTDFLKIHSRGTIKTDTYDFVKKRQEHQRKIQAERENLLKLVSKAEALRTVRAPRDGVVVKMELTEGESYGGEKAAYALSLDAPVLRADISEVRKQIVKDMRVEYRAEYETLRTNVVDVVREPGNKKYAIIQNTDEIMGYAGGMRGLIDQPIELTIIYRGRNNATLLPASAVQGDENNHYIYVADERYGLWGTQLIVRKMDVRVVETSDRMCAIEEELWGQKIITQENAYIEAGSRVMEYIQ